MPKGNPFELPDEDCERLTRSEMACLRSIMVLASDLHHAKDDLKNRLECVPGGVGRLNMILGSVDSLFKDLIGTVSDRQRRQIINQSKDMRLQIVPAMSSAGNKVMIYIDEVKELTDCAREKCKSCADTGEEARKCRLYKWLETNIPLDDYGDGFLCPYARRDWGE